MSRVLALRLKRVELRIVGLPRDKLARLTDGELDAVIGYLLRRIAESDGQIVEPHPDDERARRLYESVRDPADAMARYGHLSDDELRVLIKRLTKDCGMHLPEAYGEATHGAR